MSPPLVKRPCNFGGDDKLGDADSGSSVRETNPYCTFISIPEGSHPSAAARSPCKHECLIKEPGPGEGGREGGVGASSLLGLVHEELTSGLPPVCLGSLV